MFGIEVLVDAIYLSVGPAYANASLYLPIAAGLSIFFIYTTSRIFHTLISLGAATSSTSTNANNSSSHKSLSLQTAIKISIGGFSLLILAFSVLLFAAAHDFAYQMILGPPVNPVQTAANVAVGLTLFIILYRAFRLFSRDSTTAGAQGHIEGPVVLFPRHLLAECLPACSDRLLCSLCRHELGHFTGPRRFPACCFSFEGRFYGTWTVWATFSCGIMGPASLHCCFRPTRLDCSSKSAWTSGFAWEQVISVRAPIPDGALRRVEKHHKSIRQFYVNSTRTLDICRSFAPQLEWLHFAVAQSTTRSAPGLLRALNPQALKTLILECCDYTDRAAVLRALPPLLPNLKHIWIISEPKDQHQFLELIASNCKSLDRLSFESESSSEKEAVKIRAAISKCASQCSATLKAVDLYFLASSWPLYFPSLNGKNLSAIPTIEPAGPSPRPRTAPEDLWDWRSLDSTCKRQYGVGFEAFSAFMPRTTWGRNRSKSPLLYLADIESGAMYPNQLAEIWLFIIRWVRVDTAARMREALLASKSFLDRTKNLRAEWWHNNMVQDMVDLVRTAAESATPEVTGPLLALLISGSNEISALRDLLYEVLDTYSSHLKSKLVSKIVKSRDYLALAHVLKNPAPLVKAGISMTEEVALTLDRGSNAVTRGPLGALALVYRTGLAESLVSFPGFDLFELKLDGVPLFDAYIAKYLAAGTFAGAVRAEDLKAILNLCVASGKKSQEDLLKIFVSILDTCVPSPTKETKRRAEYSFITRIDFARPLCYFLPEEIVKPAIAAFLEKANPGVKVFPEDFGLLSLPAENSPVSFAGNVSVFLWCDLIRNVRPLMDGTEDPSLLEDMLGNLAPYGKCPNSIARFLKSDNVKCPINGIFDETEEAAVRKFLYEAVSKKNLFGSSFGDSGFTFSD